MRTWFKYLPCLTAVAAINAWASPTYPCVADSAADFRFDETRKLWNVESLGARNHKWLVKESVSPDYKWEVTKLGEDIAWVHCSNHFNERDVLSCGGYNTFQFHRATLRYVLLFRLGHVLERDEETAQHSTSFDGDLAPHIEIGTCSPL